MFMLSQCFSSFVQSYITRSNVVAVCISPRRGSGVWLYGLSTSLALMLEPHPLGKYKTDSFRNLTQTQATTFNKEPTVKSESTFPSPWGDTIQKKKKPWTFLAIRANYWFVARDDLHTSTHIWFISKILTEGNNNFYKHKNQSCGLTKWIENSLVHAEPP